MVTSVADQIWRPECLQEGCWERTWRAFYILPVHLQNAPFFVPTASVVHQGQQQHVG